MVATLTRHVSLFSSLSAFHHQFLIRYLTSGTWNPNLPLNFICGKSVEAQNELGSFLIKEPATGRIMCMMTGCGKDDVDKAVQSAKQAQEKWAELSGFERMQILQNASKLLKLQKEDVARKEVYDTGKPIWEARIDVQTAIDALQYYSGLAPTICGQHFALPCGSFAYTRREPLGVIGAIGAWNYPIQMAAWKAAPALACGNAVVFKPSQFTPITAKSLAEVFAESGLPKGLFNVIQGGAETGDLLTSHPDVAKVTFTGSVNTGTKVMENCASGIKYVTLELGGKSPLIIFEDCDLDSAIEGALCANFFSQGQVCSNATRVYIHESVFEDVVSKLVSRAKQITPGDPHLDTTKTGAMINEEHAKKVLNFIEEAREQGSEILCGGHLIEMNDPLLKGKFIAPCILKTSDDSIISQEEVFGPVMNVYSFQTEEEVVRRANDTQYGLAAGVFTKDINRAHRLAAKLQAGTCYINNYNIYPSEVPFGGFKKSGLGKENGMQTIDYFTQLKTVYVEANEVTSPF